MKQLISAILFCLSGLASAAPVTVYFSGTVYQYQTGDGLTFADDTSKTGLAFTGSLTIDAANGQLRDFSADPFNSFVERVSHSGCAAAINGVCQATLPFVTPIMIDFDITLDGNTYGPTLPDPDHGAQSGSIRKTATDTLSQLMLTGGIGKQFIEGDTSSLNYTVTNLARQLTILAQGDATWIGDLLDLGQLPDFSSLDAAIVQFGDVEYICHQLGSTCAPGEGFTPESFQFVGLLDYLSLTPRATAEVPEPGSLALLGLGLAGLAAIRKRKQG